MKVRVDATKCIAYGECTTFAPELFEQDEWDFASARNGGDVPAGLEDKARESVRICPAGAISVEE
jgi:ferredoxin